MKDLSKQIAELDSEQRQRLIEGLRNRKASSSREQSTETNGAEEYADVAVVGGGLAGLTLAIQLKKARPEIKVIVLEKRNHPAPEAAFKVGESTVEIGACYLREILGLKEYLQSDQLPKAGLRYFFSDGNNRDISRRIELGGTFLPPVSSYQLDRGRLENALAAECAAWGVIFRDSVVVKNVELGEAYHRLLVSAGEEETIIQARAVVDASGRAGLLKRKLGLDKEVGHKANAVWFRINCSFDLDEWSTDGEWQARMSLGLRQLSTNHFMGEGYWVWFIPLASGSTSIGIVTSPDLHSFSEMNRFDRALEWLRCHEPQCADVIEDKRALLQDFRVLKNYSYGCDRVFSSDSWYLTGESGVFTDPFYSPGTDFIAIGNTFIADLIVRNAAGEEVAERVEYYNRIYLHTFDSFISLYEQQYPLMGHAQVMIAKIIWDYAIYWGYVAPLFFQCKFTDLQFVASIERELVQFNRLNVLMQRLFREWEAKDGRKWRGAFIDIFSIDFLFALHKDLAVDYGDVELQARIRENLVLAESLAIEIFNKALESIVSSPWSDRLNPYAISLDPERWEADGLYEYHDSRTPAGLKDDLKKIWLEPEVQKVPV